MSAKPFSMLKLTKTTTSLSEAPSPTDSETTAVEIRSPAFERATTNIQNHVPQLKVGHPNDRHGLLQSVRSLTWSVTARMVLLVFIRLLDDGFGDMGRRLIVSILLLLRRGIISSVV